MTDQLQFSLIYKVLYLLAFFSFLRLSNILPHSVNSFDKIRYMCVGDVIFSDHRTVIVLKWSNTFQDHVKTTTLDIPYLGCSTLCPVQAFSAMLTTLPSNVGSPRFQVLHGQVFKPLTESSVMKHLKSVSALLCLSRSRNLP